MSTETNDKYYVAINLGSSHLTGVLATKHIGGRVDIVAKSRKPSRGNIVHGCIHNIHEVTNLVSQIIDELSLALEHSSGIIKGVYVGVECQSMQSRRFKAHLSLGPEGEIVDNDHLQRLLDQAREVQYPGMEVLRSVDPRYYADGKRENNPRGVRCKRIEATYQLITVRKEIVDNIRTVFEDRLGLVVHDLLISPIAEAAVTLTNEESVLGCAYINIGGGCTSISLYEGRLLSALYVLPLGGDNVTRDLTDLKILERDAETIKVRDSSMRTDISKDLYIPSLGTRISERQLKLLEVNRYVSARMLEIFGSVLNIISKASPSDSEPSKLILSGGAAQTQYLIETLQAQGGEVRLGSVRKEYVSDDLEDRLLREYHTEIALVHQAREVCVEYTQGSLDTLFDEPEAPATMPKAEPALEDTAGRDYTFGLEDEAAIESEGQQDEAETKETKQQKPKRANWLASFTSRIGRSLRETMQNINGNDE